MLKGKTAFITGANRGIGREIAYLFAKNGANLILHARKKRNLDVLLNELKKFSTELETVYFDFNDINKISNNLKKIKKDFRSIDILVNNAGVQKDGLIGMIPNQLITETFTINVYGNILISQWVSRLMMKKRSGSIINISSIMGTKGARGQTVYASSKAAINGLTLSFSKELANYKIRVNAIAPGFIETDMTKRLSASHFKSKIESIGMERIGLPIDIANLALFLGSDLSTYITGQIIHVDGGMKI